MSIGQLNESLLGSDFELVGTGDQTNWDTSITTDDGIELPVRIVRQVKSRSAKQKMSQMAREKALLRLAHPAIATYRGAITRKGTRFDVFDAPALRREDHMSLRVTPATLTDLLLEVVPAFEELHEVGLVHGALGRSTIGTTPAGAAIILGLDGAAISDKIETDIKALATFCAAALGAVEGIPVEVFLQSGNRRINRRLCSAIQGALGKDGYTPISSMTAFHGLITGKVKPGPVRKPPILTQNAEYAPAEEEVAEETTWLLPVAPEVGVQGRSFAAVSAMAICAAFIASTNVTDREARAEQGVFATLTGGIERSEDNTQLASLDLDEELLQDNWLDEIWPASENDAPRTKTTQIVQPVDLSLFRIQTAEWISAKAPTLPIPVHYSGDVLEEEITAASVRPRLDLSLFISQTADWVSATAPTGSVVFVLPPDPVEEEPTIKITASKPVDLSLFQSQTTAWRIAREEGGFDVPPPQEAQDLVLVSAVRALSGNSQSDATAQPARPEPAADKVLDIEASQLIEDTLTDVNLLSPPSAPAPVASGRVLSVSELNAIVDEKEKQTAISRERNHIRSVTRQTRSVATVRNATPIRSASSLAETTPKPLTSLTKTVAALPLKVGGVIRDCANCPDMLVLPSRSGGKNRIAMAVTETTVSQFKVFMQETGRISSATTSDRSALNPGFEQTGDHPVTYVSLDDAKAFAAWLSQRTGAQYRLPTRVEWEAAAASAPSFNGRNAAQCKLTNGADASLTEELPKRLAATCNDNYVATAPVKTFPANRLGLHDMLGNVAEWVSSSGANELHISKGGSWVSYGTELSHEPVNIERKGARLGEVGFRLVREIE